MARTQPRKIFAEADLAKFEVTVQNLELAVNKLFKGNHCESENGSSGHPLQTNTDLAHQWLLWVQKSADAWQMIWFLLAPCPSNSSADQTPAFGPELQYFGANTLQFKIQKNLASLSEEDVVALRDKLLSLITQTAPGSSASGEKFLPKFVYVRLLVSLATLIIRTVGDGNQLAQTVWGQPPDPVGQLINLFSSGQAVQVMDAHARLNILLQLLTFIPEEYGTSYLTKRIRGYVHHYCSRTAMPSVLNLVMTFLKVSATTSDQKSSALNVINAWCQFGINLSENVELLQLLFGHLMSQTDVDSSLTTEIFNCLGHLVSQPSSVKCQSTFFQLVLPTTVQSLAPFISKILSEGDENVVNAACSYLISVGDTYTGALILPPADQNLVENCARCVSLCEMILKFTNHPATYPIEETCSTLTFSFWYNLQEDLPVCLSSVSESNSHDPALISVWTGHCANLFGVLTRLIVVLCRKCQYPPEEVTDKWSPDELEQLRCYRIDCNDFISSLQSLLGVVPTASVLSQLYFSALAQVGSDNPGSHWRAIEAPLFLFSGCNTLGEAPDCALVATPVLKTFPQVMTSHPKVMESCCDLIGQLAVWMCEQSALELHSEVNVLKEVVETLTGALQLEEGLSSHAAMALKEIAAASVDELHPLAFSIFEKVKPMLYLDNLPKLTLLENLVYTVGKSISSLQNKEILHITEELLNPHTDRLMKLLNSEVSAQNSLMSEVHTNAALAATHIWISLATQLVASIDCGPTEDDEEEGEGDSGAGAGWARPGDEVDACIVLLQEIDPVIKMLMERYPNKEIVINDICSLYKRTYYNIRHRIVPVSPQICLYAVKFLSVPSEGLSHATSLLHIFTTQNLLPDIQSSCSVIQQSFQIIAKSALNSDSTVVSHHYSDPDFAAELYYWLLDLLKERESLRLFSHAIATNRDLLLDVFKLLLKGLNRQESMAFRNCIAAITEFVKFSAANRNLADMHACCVDGMSFIIESVCDVLTGISPNINGLDSYAGLLQQLSIVFPTELELTLKNCLFQSKYATTLSSEAERSYFISNVLKEKCSKSNMREVCNSFHISCVGSQTNNLLMT